MINVSSEDILIFRFFKRPSSINPIFIYRAIARVLEARTLSSIFSILSELFAHSISLRISTVPTPFSYQPSCTPMVKLATWQIDLVKGS